MAERGLSQRHVCRLLAVDPKTVRRPERRGDEAARARLRALAGKRRRFSYRRLGILLEREGMVMHHKKLYRLYREEGLAVRRRRGRKRATGTRAPERCRRRPISAGRSTSSRTALSPDVFASWSSSTTSPVSAWRRSPTPRSPAHGLRASWTRSSPGGVARISSSATMARS
jgi:hypothetical protein